MSRLHHRLREQVHDPDNRQLALLAMVAFTARQAKAYLLHQLEEKREKRLLGYFDTVQVELVSCLPAWATRPRVSCL